MENYFLTVTLKPHAINNKPNVLTKDKQYLVIGRNNINNKILFINDLNDIDNVEESMVTVTGLLTDKEKDKIIADKSKKQVQCFSR